MRADARHESGFTLTELVVVLGILSIILGATYAASQAIMAGGRVNEAQASFARDSGEPMRIINKSIMQATSIEFAGPNRIVVTTDRDLNEVQERMQVTATSDGRLLYETWGNGVPITAAPSASIAWSTNCVNDTTNPLFRYFEVVGSAQTEKTGTEALAADLIVVDLRLSLGDSDFSSSQSVLLRNRQ